MNLYIDCPVCWGKPIPRVPASGIEEVPVGARSAWVDKPCHRCEGRGIVVYGTEPGHVHQWTIDVERTPNGWTADALKDRLISCACGRSAAE